MEYRNYIMSQLIFKFPFKTKYYEQDFYVSSNNFSAYKLVESWPNWPGKMVEHFWFIWLRKDTLIQNTRKKIDKIKIIDAKELMKILLKK